LASKGGLGNYPANNTSVPNFAAGGFGGIGGGIFITNAGNDAALGGPFSTFIAALGPLGVEVDYGTGNYVVFSVTYGKSAG
jgi:hypothetical protein